MSKLVILGNGFDIRTGRKSEYIDFFNVLKNQGEYKEVYDYFFNFETNNSLEKIKTAKINIWWLLLCSYHNDSEEKYWKDIESIIKGFLVSRKSPYNLNLLDIINNHNIYWEKDYIKPNVQNVGSDSAIMRFLKVAYFNQTLNSFFIGLFRLQEEHDSKITELDESTVSLLMDDLNELEHLFMEYMDDLKHHPSYSKARYDSMLFHLLGFSRFPDEKPEEYMERKKREISLISFISFNYTIPESELGFDYDDYKYVNIHGSIRDSVIFGIGSNAINPLDKRFIFTKDFRCMKYLGDEVKSLQSKINLSDINEMIIYGHSLNEQDQNYYFAIFNTKQINTNSDFIIKFYYSDYGNKSRLQERIVELNRLFYEYERQFNIPPGLFTRLRIEKRVVIKKLIEN